MPTKPLFDTRKKPSDAKSSGQKALDVKRELDRYNDLRESLTKELKQATADLNALPGTASSERKELKDKIKRLQRAINDCDVQRETLKTEFTTHGIHMIDESLLPRKFNKATCIQNIRYLLGKKEVRLGDIERASGNSPGYLSRIEKPDSTTDPSIEFLMNAAEMLGVGLDELTGSRIEDASPNEEMLSAFLERLGQNTKKDDLYWTAELTALHSTYENTDPTDDCPHVLYKLEMDEDEATKSVFPTCWTYCSEFFPMENIVVCGTSYHTKITADGDEIYLMKCRERSDGEGTPEPFIEMYHVDTSHEVNPVCCSRYSRGKIASGLEKLYKLVMESNGRVRLSKSTRRMMELYIQ